MRILFILSIFTFCLFACKNKPAKKTEKKEEPAPAPDSTLIKQERDSVLLGVTKEVLTAFKNKDYASLAVLIHPEEGVRFSPYAYIDTATDKVVSAEWIKQQAGNKQEKILWGTIDPTDEPINRTINDYANSFVYDANFLQPEKFKVNEFLGSGNTTNNLLSFYKGCDFTESHFSGFEKKYEGMDWTSVRLVFKKKDGRYFLVGVVHDQWTI